LNSAAQDEIKALYPGMAISRFLRGGAVDVDAILADFQAFWRANSDMWRKKYNYAEEAPHLVMQAFLQRIVNGGAVITREMATGTGAVDLCVEYNGRGYLIELKLRRGLDVQPHMEQVLGYMDKRGCARGWLVYFDLRSTASWEEKIYVKDVEKGGKTVSIYGC
jgi:RecB family endonuclease NucS